MKNYWILSLLVATFGWNQTNMLATTIDQNDPVGQTATTSVSYRVEPTYSLIIPTSIVLVKQENNTYEGSGVISTEAMRLHKNATVDVMIRSDFELESAQGAKISYRAKMQGDDTELTSGDMVAQFTTAEAKQSVTLTYFATNPTYAGDYRDTVTFTIVMNNHTT